MDLYEALVTHKARAMAHQAHANQRDKAGAPYTGHLERVAATVARDPLSPAYAQAVAWLHDIIEDTPTTAEYLLGHGIPDEVVAAVAALTHYPNEPRTDYYARVRANDLACHVKLADIADNADPARLALLDPTTRERLERKYATARAALTGPPHHS